MTPQELKNSILQLAIQGKLVEQRLEEGTAAELLEKIARHGTHKTAGTHGTKSRTAHRASFVSSVSSVSDVPVVSPIPDDEKPFDIPESWEWVRLGEVFQHNTGKALNSSDKTGTPLSYITTSNVYWNRFELGKLKTMLFSDSEVDKCTIRKGDLLVLEGGDVGRSAIWNYDFPMRIQNHIHRLRPLIDICVQYVYYIFMLYKNANMISGKGISIKGLSANALHNLPIPLPPLAEQKRIVAKIEELLPLIDRYEKAWSKLEDFNKRFPVDMQKSLLQMAIQGKLVEQHSEEGTAAELLEKILATKNAKGAKKNLTRSRGVRGENKTSALSASPHEKIPDDEKPFDIPDSWVWCLVGDLFNHNTGKAMNSSAKATHKSGKVRKFITTSNVYWNSFDLTSLKEMFFSDDELERCSAKKNDILMCEGGAYYGRAAIWKNDYDICFQNHIHRLRPHVPICEEFFYYVFFFYRNNGMMKPKGTAMPGLSSIVLHNLLIPLPPLAEQRRIVAKLEELLPLCERLK